MSSNILALDAAKLRCNELQSVVQHEFNNNNEKDYIPRHLRRRATSYNRWRISEKSKQGLNKKGDDKKKEKKEMNRKDKRRGINFLLSRESSTCDIRRLENHTWMAKRMFMEQRWGYLLPLRACNVAEQASVKISDIYTSIHDSSYFTCVQLQGYQEVIFEGMREIMDPLHPVLNDLSWVQGRCRGQFVIHAKGQFPHGAISPVWSICKSLSKGSKEMKVWIWLHPACNEQILQQLYAVQKENDIQILNADLQLLSIRCAKKSFEKTNKVVAKVFNCTNIMADLKLSVEKESNGVACLTLRDLVFNNGSTLAGCCANLEEKDSIWNQEYRNKSSNLHLTFLQGGKGNEGEAKEDYFLTVMLVHYSDSRNAGWDIILPKHWNRSVFHSFILSGCICIGMETMRLYDCLSLTPSFPSCFIDSHISYEYAKHVRDELLKEDSAKPKAKRINYKVTHSESPFFIDWGLLYNDDVNENEDLIEVEGEGEEEEEGKEEEYEEDGKEEEEKEGGEGEKEVTEKEKMSAVDDGEYSFMEICVVRGWRYLSSLLPPQSKQELSMHALIEVDVFVYGRGKLQERMMVYSPNLSDLQSIYKDKAIKERSLDNKQDKIIGFITNAAQSFSLFNFVGKAFIRAEFMYDLVSTQCAFRKEKGIEVEFHDEYKSLSFDVLVRHNNSLVMRHAIISVAKN